MTLEDVVEKLEGDICELSLGENSNFKEDEIYGYMAEVDNTISLAALCSEEVLNAGKGYNLDSNSDNASLVPQEVQQYLFLAWNCQLLTISSVTDHATLYLLHTVCSTIEIGISTV